MNIARLGAVFITGVVVVIGLHTPASAASPVTRAFLDNLLPNVDFLDRSSRFALTNSMNARVHEFAFNEAKEQTLAANVLDEWSQGNKVASVTPASVDGDRLITGRSVAVEGQTATPVDERLPHGQEDLNSLEGLSGSAFDEEYRAKQLDALRQVQSDYQDYIAKGDDPVLLGIASRELPKVRRRLALLGKI